MTKQLSLFPELVTSELVSNLDEEVCKYPISVVNPSEPVKEAIRQAYKDGMLKVLGDIIDLLKKYTDLHES